MDYLNRMAPSEVLTHRLLERRAAEAPDALFFSFQNESFTLGHCNRMANRMARNLQEAGITTGTHVAVFMDTSAEYMYLWMALSKVGAVEVPINTAYRGDVLKHVLHTCQATACILDDRFIDTVDEASFGFAQFKQVFAAPGRASALPPRGQHLASLLAPNDESNLTLLPRYDDVTCII
ncbi:MAG: AMP-binding protein, partial [Sideroxyarcus sp.]|nr:AMP-binding protein [Sideroxyarcus sp.]